MEYNGSPESVGYKIKYSRSDGHGKTLSHVVLDRVEREYTIEDLEEWMEYRVQVQAFNAIGSGPWSPVVLGRTRESGTPPHLTALRAARGHTGLELLSKSSLSSFLCAQPSTEHPNPVSRPSAPAPLHTVPTVGSRVSPQGGNVVCLPPALSFKPEPSGA